MKTNNIIIRRENTLAKGKTAFPCAYDTTTEVDGVPKRVKRVLTKDLEVLEVSPSANSYDTADLVFSTDNMHTVVIDLNVPGRNKEKLKNFFKDSPDARRPHESNSRASFIYEIEEDIRVDKRNSDKEKVEIYQRFEMCDDNERNAIAVHFGVAPWDLDKDDLVTRVVGLTDGVVSNNVDARQEFLSSKKLWKDEHTLNFRSAVMNNIIVSNNSVYTLEGELLGSSSEQSIMMLKQRDDLYSIVKRELGRIGKAFLSKEEKKEMEVKAEIDRQQADISDTFDELGVTVDAEGEEPPAPNRGGRPRKNS